MNVVRISLVAASFLGPSTVMLLLTPLQTVSIRLTIACTNSSSITQRAALVIAATVSTLAVEMLRARMERRT